MVLQQAVRSCSGCKNCSDELPMMLPVNAISPVISTASIRASCFTVLGALISLNYLSKQSLLMLLGIERVKARAPCHSTCTATSLDVWQKLQQQILLAQLLRPGSPTKDAYGRYWRGLFIGFSGDFCHALNSMSLYWLCFRPGLSCLSSGSSRSMNASKAAFTRLHIKLTL